jgi:hypothetical protein
MWKDCWKGLLPAALTIALVGCSKDGASEAHPAPSAKAHSAPSVTAPALSASTAAPAASAPEPQHDCPDGSSGSGSLAKPCEAKGSARMMEATWTKTTDAGPTFRVTNKSKLPILYGKVTVYFYDKAGKQLELKDDGASGGKPRSYHTCSGLIFGGVMNPGEKAVLTFSCVPKKVVPENTASIEAEFPVVGYADSTGKKTDFYWKNGDLTPDARTKGAK